MKGNRLRFGFGWRAVLLAAVGLMQINLWGQRIPLEIVQFPAVDYPESARTSEYPTGLAQVAIYVDGEGQLQDALLLGASLPVFGETAMEAVRKWSYHPARVGENPITVRKVIEFEFSAEGSVVTRSPSGHLQERVRSMTGPGLASRMAGLADLDTPLQAIEAISPQPVSVPSRTEITVNFFVDEDGQPRMPIVQSGDHPGAIGAALEAVRDWRFTPVRKNGKPAVVEVSQPFVFHPAVAEN